jgi:hypothetical protein
MTGQAKGTLTARHRVDADQAFGRLRSLSQQTNRKLRDVARQLVERRSAGARDGRGAAASGTSLDGRYRLGVRNGFRSCTLPEVDLVAAAV